MEKINVLTNKYKFVNVETDPEVPYKYLPQSIKELKQDIKEIDKIISDENNGAVLKACKVLKSKLNFSLKFFEKKLDGIPNLNYMDESDEEWVDNNLPVIKKTVISL